MFHPDHQSTKRVEKLYALSENASVILGVSNEPKHCQRGDLAYHDHCASAILAEEESANDHKKIAMLSPEETVLDPKPVNVMVRPTIANAFATAAREESLNGHKKIKVLSETQGHGQ